MRKVLKSAPSSHWSGTPAAVCRPSSRNCLAALQGGVVGIAHDDARGLEARGSDARVAVSLEQRSHRRADLLLLGAQLRKAARAGLEHRVPRSRERVGRHRRVVQVRTALVGLHHLQPLPKIGGVAGAGGAFDALAGEIRKHHEGAARRAAPALLRGAHEHVHAGGLEVDPHGARGNAVEHEQAAHFVRGVGHGAKVVVGQHHAGGGFDVRREHDRGPLGADRPHHFVDRGRRERLLRAGARAARLQYRAGRRDASHLEDLGPAEAEPSASNDEAGAIRGELPRHRFHAEGPAAGNDDGRAGPVGLLEHAGDVAHDALELPRHVVQRPVGVDDGELEQAVGIDVRKQAGHGGLPGGNDSECGDRPAWHRPRRSCDCSGRWSVCAILRVGRPGPRWTGLQKFGGRPRDQQVDRTWAPRPLHLCVNPRQCPGPR